MGKKGQIVFASEERKRKLELSREKQLKSSNLMNTVY